MTTLTVMRPRGQRQETFHDSDIERIGRGDEYTKVQVYLYEVMPDGSLKVYACKVSLRWGQVHLDEAKIDEAYEVAHFRSNQWDTVRNGR